MKGPSVIILAAGRGTRMSAKLPKALVPVGGVPMIMRSLMTVARAGFDIKPVVVVGYKGALVKQIGGNRARYVTQRQQLGTGHAVAAARPFLRGRVNQVVVVYGDHPFVTPLLLNRLVKMQRGRRAVLACATTVVPDFRGPRQTLLRYGRIVRARDRSILRCVEYKDATLRERRIREVNSGYYCFDAAWLWKNLKLLRRDNVQHEYYLTDLIGLAVAQGRRVVLVVSRNWREGLGINTDKERQVAEKFVKRFGV